MAKVLVPDIEPPLLEGFGRVISTWAFADSLLGDLFTFMIEANPGAAYVITQNVMSGTLTNWIRTMTPIKFTNGPGTG